jgi:hypothetical protein
MNLVSQTSLLREKKEKSPKKDKKTITKKNFSSLKGIEEKTGRL